MRKHPLIALTAFTALGASAIAGASTGTLSNTVLSSSRVNHVSKPTPQQDRQPILFSAALALPREPQGRNLVAVHDPNRPEHTILSSLTGLPVVAVPKPKPKPKPVVIAVAPAPAPAPVPVPVPVAPPVAPTTTTVVVPSAPTGGVWYELRVCESSDNYAEDTGNGFYGAYQFSLSTWYGLGFTGLPSDASPATQDRAAAELQAESGWGQWPSCSAQLGL
ncbi:MAG: transglycosylase family protein [Acidimicrobiales bacterium]|jgi:hypothetical protein